MIDIHTHILPNVDDGAKDMAMSLEMLAEAANNGISKVILTPHIVFSINKETDKQILINAFESLQQASKDIPVKLYLGSEIYYSPEAVKALEDGKVLTLNNTKYVLIEFSLIQKIYDIENALYNLRIKQFIPVLAHPERYPYLSIKEIKAIKESGSIIQVNTTSILGNFGKDVQKKVIKMIKLGLVDNIASDCHTLGIRKPNLAEAIRYLKEKHKIQWKDSKIINDIVK